MPTSVANTVAVSRVPRSREEDGNGLGDGHSALDRRGCESPVSRQESLHVEDVLNRNRVSQMELLHDRMQERVVDVARPKLWRAIDRNREVRPERVAQGERDDGHAEQR